MFDNLTGLFQERPANHFGGSDEKMRIRTPIFHKKSGNFTGLFF